MHVTEEAKAHVPRHPVGVPRPRPKVCAVCRTFDTEYEEQEVHVLVFITRDMGTVYRLHPKHTYSCADHTGMVG